MFVMITFINYNKVQKNEIKKESFNLRLHPITPNKLKCTP